MWRTRRNVSARQTHAPCTQDPATTPAGLRQWLAHSEIAAHGQPPGVLGMPLRLGSTVEKLLRQISRTLLMIRPAAPAA
ncbi:MAG: hypothetical protein CK538_04480 [Opitutia bacterium]|nr:MAG: hypothetical protein CK538_04480 [Opitutae bacterium]